MIDWLVLFFSYIFRLSLELVGESASRQIDQLLLALYNSTYHKKNCLGTYWKQCSSYFSHLQFVGIWGLRQKKKESCSPNLRLDYLVFSLFFFPMIPLHFWRVTCRAYRGPAFGAGFYSAESKLLELNCAHTKIFLIHQSPRISKGKTRRARQNKAFCGELLICRRLTKRLA